MNFYLVAFMSATVMWSAKALSLEDFKQKFTTHIMECAQTYPLSPAETESLKNKEVPTGENPKCLLACAYKKMGIMDDKGNISLEGIKKITREYSSDATLVAKGDAFAETCKEVNNDSVSDGEKGCDRAALLLKCIFEKASEFDFV